MQRRGVWVRLWVLMVGGVIAPPALGAPCADTTVELEWPLDGVHGVNWSILSYPDGIPATTDVSDYMGSDPPHATNDHFATDILLPSFRSMDDGMARVYAAADGMLRTDLSVADRVFDRSVALDPACATEACAGGNRLVIERFVAGATWRELYAHFKYGSFSPRIAQAIAACTPTSCPNLPITQGEILGVVGSSGYSSFPHLHYELQCSDSEGFASVDPFQRGMWLATPTYDPTHRVMELVVSATPVTAYASLWPAENVTQARPGDVLYVATTAVIAHPYPERGACDDTASGNDYVSLELARPGSIVVSERCFDVADIPPPPGNADHYRRPQPLNQLETFVVGSTPGLWLVRAVENDWDSMVQSVVVEGFDLADIALYGADWVSVNDRAQVVSNWLYHAYSGDPATVLSGGTVWVRVDAVVGDVWTPGTLAWADRARIGRKFVGDITPTPGAIGPSMGPAYVPAPSELPELSPFAGVYDAQCPLHSYELPTYSLEPDRYAGDPALSGGQPVTRAILPGECVENFVAKSRSRVVLGAGTYYFARLQVEPEATVVFDTSAGPVRLVVETSLDLKGWLGANEASESLVVVPGAPYGYVYVTGTLRGTLVAPTSTVNLDTGYLEGAVFGGAVTLHQGMVLNHVPFDGDLLDGL